MDLWRRVDSEAYTATNLPTFPARTLLTHVAWKGVQLGSVAGVVISPLYAIVRAQPLTSVYRKVLWRTTVAGTVGSLALLAYKEFQGELTVEGVDDRAYRIHVHKKQTAIDNMSLLGACFGATAGAIVGTRGHKSVVTGALTGVAAAVAVYALEEATHPAAGAPMR